MKHRVVRGGVVTAVRRAPQLAQLNGGVGFPVHADGVATERHVALDVEDVLRTRERLEVSKRPRAVSEKGVSQRPLLSTQAHIST